MANLNLIRSEAVLCAGWPVAAGASSLKVATSSGVPTLVLQGAYDASTPVVMGRRAARELTNCRLVIVPQQGHEVWTKADNCAGRLAIEFLSTPAQWPDETCLERRRPRWALPSL